MNKKIIGIVAALAVVVIIVLVAMENPRSHRTGRQPEQVALPDSARVPDSFPLPADTTRRGGR